MIDIRESSRNVLIECFRQFGMEPHVLPGNSLERMKREKFEACVVHLTPESQGVMEAARTSPSSSHMVIYGLGGSAQDALRFSKFGVNAVFHEPLERPAALKLVRATQMLVFHEFKRYVRIPVITEVSVGVTATERFTATSQELSSGGMSIQTKEAIAPGQTVEVSFALLTLPRIWVRGTVSWRKPASQTAGIRFDPKDDRRLRIKEWIDAYLEN